MVLRANRLMRVLSVRLLCSIRWVNVFSVRCISPSIASPVITGDKAYLERRKQAQQPTAWAKGIGNDSFSLGIKGIPKPMTMVFVADIGPLLIKITDKCHVIEHHHLGGYLLWGEFFRARMTVLMPMLRTRAESRAPEPLNAISTIYVVRVAMRAVNGDGYHGTMSLKGPHHTRSTDRRYYPIIQDNPYSSKLFIVQDDINGKRLAEMLANSYLPTRHQMLYKCIFARRKIWFKRTRSLW